MKQWETTEETRMKPGQKHHGPSNVEKLEGIKDKMLSKKILSEQQYHPLSTSEERPRRNPPKKVRKAR